MAEPRSRRKDRRESSSISRPFIVPIFLPHAGCPNRCVFCNQTSLTGSRNPVPSPEAVKQRIEVFLATRRPERKPVEIAFYGGNFFGLSPRAVERLLTVAAGFADDGRIHGIRFSTRPDSITGRRLAWVEGYPVTTVELGAQSMNDDVLARCERGHTALDTSIAVKALRESGIAVGVQLMIGLPGDSDASALETARLVAELAPDFVRIYPTLVVSDSPLAQMFLQGEYQPQTLNHAVQLAKRLYLVFLNRRIPVVRMGLQETDELASEGTLLAGPHHPAFGEMVISACFLDLAFGMLRKLSAFTDTAVFRIHPRSESKFRGRRNSNIAALRAEFALRHIRVETDPGLDEGALALGRHPAAHLSKLGAAL